MASGATVGVHAGVRSGRKASIIASARKPHLVADQEGRDKAVQREGSVFGWLLDRQLLPRRRGLLDQLEFEDTIVEFGLARRIVQLHR